MICGANTWSIVVVVDTTEAWTQCACGLAGLSRLAIGPAAAATTMVSGTRMITDHVIRAEVIWLTWAFASGSEPERSAERASTGTIAVVSAPPRTSS